jgi:hypothetical protein
MTVLAHWNNNTGISNLHKVAYYPYYLTTSKNKIMTELQLQAQCYQWAHNTYPQLRKLLFAVPNGGTRHAREAMSLKASGVVSGVPDMICVYGGRPVAFELKAEKGRLSEDQREVLQKWSDHGITVHVIKTVEEFQTIIKTIIS